MDEQRVKEIVRDESGGCGFLLLIAIIAAMTAFLIVSLSTIIPEFRDAQRRIAILEQRIQQLESQVK